MHSPSCRTPWLMFLFVLGAVLAAPAIGSGIKKKGKKTHLGVTAAEIANLETYQVPNDNTGGHLFYFDRQLTPVTIPVGSSFIVTDVFVEPTGTTVNDSKYYLVVLELGGRSFVVQFGGSNTHHIALRGGMVIPGGVSPTARNTTSSTNPVGVRLQGYYVTGDVPAPGSSPF